MGDGAAVLAYLFVGVIFGASAYRIVGDEKDGDRFGLAFATFLCWPLALAFTAIAYTMLLVGHRERLLIFSEEGRLHARARRARRDLRLLELRREAEAAEDRYRRSLDKMIEEASR